MYQSSELDISQYVIWAIVINSILSDIYSASIAFGKNRSEGIWFTPGLISGGLALLALIALSKNEYYNNIEDTEEEILINKIVIAYDKGESSVKVYVLTLLSQ